MSSLNGKMNFCVARGMATSLSCKFALRLAHPPEPNGLSSAPAWWIWGGGRDMTEDRKFGSIRMRGWRPGVERPGRARAMEQAEMNEPLGTGELAAEVGAPPIEPG
jgi:hypothetical protein